MRYDYCRAGVVLQLVEMSSCSVCLDSASFQVFDFPALFTPLSTFCPTCAILLLDWSFLCWEARPSSLKTSVPPSDYRVIVVCFRWQGWCFLKNHAGKSIYCCCVVMVRVFLVHRGRIKSWGLLTRSHCGVNWVNWWWSHYCCLHKLVKWPTIWIIRVKTACVWCAVKIIRKDVLWEGKYQLNLVW